MDHYAIDFEDERRAAAPSAAALPTAPTPSIGDEVCFFQGIRRYGRIVKVGSKRAEVAFRYHNGRQATTHIALAILVKAPGIGWLTSGYKGTAR